MGDEEGLNGLAEMDKILKIVLKSIEESRRVYMIHPDTYNKFTDSQKEFLKTQGQVLLSSCIEPTKIYISKAVSLLNYPIDYWEEV